MYVVILACIEAITIAILMILHNLYGPGLQPGRCWCQGMVGRRVVGVGGASVRPEGR